MISLNIKREGLKKMKGKGIKEIYGFGSKG